MEAGIGDTGQYPVIGVGRVEIRAIPADDDLVAHRAGGVETEYPPHPGRGHRAADGAGELHIADFRRWRRQGNAQGQQHFFGLRLGGRGGDVAEEDGVLGLLGSDPRGQVAVDHGIVAAQRLVQWFIVIQEAERVGVQGVTVQVQAAQVLLVAVAVRRHVVEGGIQGSVVAPREAGEGKSVHPPVQVDGAGGGAAHRDVPGGYRVVAGRHRAHQGIGPATAAGGEDHPVDPGDRRLVTAGVVAGADHRAVGPRQFLGAGGDAARAAGAGAGEIRAGGRGLIAAGAEILGIVDIDLTAPARAHIAGTGEDELAGLGVDVDKAAPEDAVEVDVVGACLQVQVGPGAVGDIAGGGVGGRIQVAAALGQRQIAETGKADNSGAGETQPEQGAGAHNHPYSGYEKTEKSYS